MREKSIFLIWPMIFVLLFGSIKNSLILNFYLLDNKDFTELFCENRDKPAEHCNGNCQLSKMANQTDGNEVPALLQQLKTESVFLTKDFHFEIPEFYKSHIHNFYYLDRFQSADLKRFTPPPVFG
ncbi:MAG: hypothetical protein WCY16_09425 [Weeksellaceae bacterium]